MRGVSLHRVILCLAFLFCLCCCDVTESITVAGVVLVELSHRRVMESNWKGSAGVLRAGGSVVCVTPPLVVTTVFWEWLPYTVECCDVPRRQATSDKYKFRLGSAVDAAC